MKKTAALFLAVLMLLSLSACEKGSDLILTTGGEEGTYYSFGQTLAAKVSEKTKTNVTVVPSSGSKVNIEALLAGDAQLAFVQSDVAAYAYEGTRLFEESGRVAVFYTVAALYKEKVQIVTLDPDIRSVSDLRGKRVSIGAAGSGVYFNAVDVLNVYGINVDRGDISPTYLSFKESADALREGMIDAAFIVAGTPAPAVSQLAESQTVYLVGMDEAHIDELLSKSPYYSRDLIAKDVYGTQEDVNTVAVTALIVARKDVPEKDVYNFITTVFGNASDIAAEHPKGAELDLETAASYSSVPYHPGAARFFNEKKLTVNTGD